LDFNLYTVDDNVMEKRIKLKDIKLAPETVLDKR